MTDLSKLSVAELRAFFQSCVYRGVAYEALAIAAFDELADRYRRLEEAQGAIAVSEEDKDLPGKQEAFVLNVTEEIWRVMQEKGLLKADLARLLGSSKAHVTQLLNGSRNMTLYTLAEICVALGETPHFALKRRIEGEGR